MSQALTAQRAKQLLAYDPGTGILTWRIAAGRWGRIPAGSIAGSLMDTGYITVRVDGKPHKAHRLAWLIHNGVWPADQLDHIDGRRSNNRLANLREVSNSVNQQNLRGPRRKNSASGLLGVTICQGRFVASIKVDGKARYLGRYKDAGAAQEAYLNAKRQQHVGCRI